MAVQARILSFKIEPNETETKIIFTFGLKTIERNIPIGYGLVRASAMLDEKGQLADVEIITDKV